MVSELGMTKDAAELVYVQYNHPCTSFSQDISNILAHYIPVSFDPNEVNIYQGFDSGLAVSIDSDIPFENFCMQDDAILFAWLKTEVKQQVSCSSFSTSAMNLEVLYADIGTAGTLFHVFSIMGPAETLYELSTCEPHENSVHGYGSGKTEAAGSIPT
ncbi:hypothetical protein FF38_10528 [Lucilia cuprina]|uniref:Uncharacterized protein n=1 Tax=Lucilia cuprina TaxID=7375 RepID=A0A0L0BWS8_LUCCU|nr:hypothetical protein FF38_10528 [Lucilia cuprina]